MAILPLSGLAASTARATNTVTGGYIETVATVSANADNSMSAGGSDSQDPMSDFSNASSYYVPATAEVTDTSGSAQASAQADVETYATLNASGFTASFQGTTIAASSGAQGSANAAGDLGLEYDFTPNISTAYTLTYDLSTPSLGCCGSAYTIEYLNSGKYTLYHTTYNSDTSGTLVGMLTAGVQYRLDISQGQYPYYEAATVSGVRSQTVGFDDEYSFAAGALAGAAAPAPACWGFTIFGGGVWGAGLRRGRRRAPEAVLG